MPRCRPFRSVTIGLRFLGVLAALVSSACLPARSADPVLTRHPSGEPVEPASLRGSVVVLDFFAHWCGPCLAATRELKSGVDEWYRASDRNPGGMPVRVVTVNIDTSAPARTARFVVASGATEVWEDAEGRWHAALGGKALPFVVVLDAREAVSPDEARVVARFEGTTDVARIRQVIDALGSPQPEVPETTPSGADSDAASAGTTEPGGWFDSPSIRLLEAGWELLAEEDFRLDQAFLAWREQRRAWDYLAQVQWQRFDLDFVPAPSDFISQAGRLREDTVGFQGRVRMQLAERWQGELGGGLTEGFGDYRSVWLDHYYRQYFGTVRGYVEAEPRGYNLVPGVRWELRPGAAFLQASFIHQHDEISPGYEKEPFQPLVRGTARLDTFAGSLSLEHVLNRRSRLAHDVRITDTTNRDLRYGYKGSWNWVAAPSVVVRSYAGVTWEPPQFLAWFAQTGIEKDWGDRWFVGAFVRTYADDGLIQDPRIVSNAAPPLRTLRTGLSLRFQSPRLSARLAAGPYFSRYDAVPPNSDDFRSLYADRDWLFVESAVGWNF